MRNRIDKVSLVGFALLLLVPGAVYPQSESIFKRLNGSWSGEGKTLEMPATLRMSWEWVLGEKFLRLSLKNEMKAASGNVQLFEGHAYYQPSEGKCEGTWFDSRGMSFPIKCTVEAQSLTAMWGVPGQENGKSVYAILAGGKLEVVDSVKQKDGSWKEFGRFVMARDK
jgi:hypothetical protein